MQIDLHCKTWQDVFHIITFQRQGLSAGRDASKQRGLTCSAANTEQGVCLCCRRNVILTQAWERHRSSSSNKRHQDHRTPWWEMSSWGVTQLFCFLVCRGREKEVKVFWIYGRPSVVLNACIKRKKKLQRIQPNRHIAPFPLRIHLPHPSCRAVCLNLIPAPPSPCSAGWGCLCPANIAPWVAMTYGFMAAQCKLSWQRKQRSQRISAATPVLGFHTASWGPSSCPLFPAQHILPAGFTKQTPGAGLPDVIRDLL